MDGHLLYDYSILINDMFWALTMDSNCQQKTGLYFRSPFGSFSYYSEYCKGRFKAWIPTTHSILANAFKLLYNRYITLQEDFINTTKTTAWTFSQTLNKYSKVICSTILMKMTSKVRGFGFYEILCSSRYFRNYSLQQTMFEEIEYRKIKMNPWGYVYFMTTSLALDLRARRVSLQL